MHLDRTSFARAFAIAGTVLQIALPVALLRLAPSLSNLFHAVFDYGLADPSSLVAASAEFIEYCKVELILALLGLVLLCVALAFYRYRARWFFRFLVVYGVFLLPAFPVGTVFGLYFHFYCLTHRREFPA